MKKPDEFLAPEEWKKIACKDWQRVKYNSDLKVFYKLCERVTGYYFAERYPPLSLSELTCEDIEGDLDGARGLIQAMFSEETE